MELTFKELRERNLPLLWADQRVELGFPGTGSENDCYRP